MWLGSSVTFPLASVTTGPAVSCGLKEMAECGRSLWNSRSWSQGSVRAVMGRSTRSVTEDRPTAFGMERIFSRISGARFSIPMIWVTLPRVSCSRVAISLWLVHSPDLRRVCHSMAFLRSSVTRGRFGSLGSLGLLRRGGRALTAEPPATRCLRVPMLLSSNTSLGPRATSTVCSW